MGLKCTLFLTLYRLLLFPTDHQYFNYYFGLACTEKTNEDNYCIYLSKLLILKRNDDLMNDQLLLYSEVVPLN